MDYLNHINSYPNLSAYNQDNTKEYPNVSYLIEEDEVNFITEEPFDKQYLTIVSIEDSNVISFKCSTDKDGYNKTISVSTDDGETWQSKTSSNSGVVLATLNTGDKLLIKGNNSSYSAYASTTTDGYYNCFTTNKKFEVKGNIMSLIYGDNFKNKVVLNSNNTFEGLFYYCANMVSAENLILPAIALTSYCYHNMFFRCNKIAKAPVLPATTLGSFCYQTMFKYCNSLTTAPVLTATTLAEGCYSHMFEGCTSLTTAPVLPATTLANYCYDSMFYGCSSLVNAPTLSATTLVAGCYNYMFSQCSSLVDAPALPATNLIEAKETYLSPYAGMFNGCRSLENAPVLPATTLKKNCYYKMFYNCRSLKYIKAMFTTKPSTTYTDNWVYNVSTTGTFVKNSSARWNVTGVNGVPSGWTIQTENQ